MVHTASFSDPARESEKLNELYESLNEAVEAARANDQVSARVEPTAGHPVVRGEWLGAPGAPTVLVYGHFDVQPTGSDAEWLSKPFELNDLVEAVGRWIQPGP